MESNAIAFDSFCCNLNNVPVIAFDSFYCIMNHVIAFDSIC